MSEEGFVREQHEGERYLELLGFDLNEVGSREIPTAEGTIQARDFLNVCGEHARPLLVGFESMSPDDPAYAGMRNLLRGLISSYIEKGAGPA